MNWRSIRLTAMIGVVILLASIFSLPVTAGVTHITSNQLDPYLQDPVDSTDLESFFDEFFEQNMEELSIPGAAVVVVKDGEILFIEGYGFADIERQIPVDPAQTIMRVGSVSKLFTATAAMQLVEQGLLDLDTDVNQYLTTLEIPDDYSEPVTLHQLLTHTAGFEDSVVGTYTLNPDEYLPLADYVKRSIPERVLEPGSVHSYSNFSFALAGLLVEEVTGVPFEQYVAENLFQPLGMMRSTFAQPIPTELAKDFAVGYFVTDGEYEPGGYLYLQEPPEGSMSSTAEDMARFMIAHLQAGSYEDVQILEEATARQMHEQQFTHHPELPGLGYAFKERFVNGERLIGHGGDIGAYSSQIILHPEDNLGLFVAYNVFNDTLRERLIMEFMDRYYPQEPTSQTQGQMELNPEELERYTGGYTWVRHERSTIGKVLALLPGPINVNITANEDNTLSVSFFGADPEWRYAPVEPLVFKQVEGGVQEFSGLAIDLGDTLAFRENESGEVEFAFVPIQNVALEKVAWYEASEFQFGSLGIFLFVFLLPVIIWPLGSLIRIIRKQPSNDIAGSSRAKWLAIIVCVFNFSFLLILILTLSDFGFGVPLIVQIALVIPIVTALLSLVMVWMTYKAWKERYWSVLGRLFYTFLTLLAIYFIVWANYWNLLGWRF